MTRFLSRIAFLYVRNRLSTAVTNGISIRTKDVKSNLVSRKACSMAMFSLACLPWKMLSGTSPKCTTPYTAVRIMAIAAITHTYTRSTLWWLEVQSHSMYWAMSTAING